MSGRLLLRGQKAKAQAGTQTFARGGQGLRGRGRGGGTEVAKPLAGRYRRRQNWESGRLAKGRGQEYGRVFAVCGLPGECQCAGAVIHGEVSSRLTNYGWGQQDAAS